MKLNKQKPSWNVDRDQNYWPWPHLWETMRSLMAICIFLTRYRIVFQKPNTPYICSNVIPSCASQRYLCHSKFRIRAADGDLVCFSECTEGCFSLQKLKETIRWFVGVWFICCLFLRWWEQQAYCSWAALPVGRCGAAVPRPGGHCACCWTECELRKAPFWLQVVGLVLSAGLMDNGVTHWS